MAPACTGTSDVATLRVRGGSSSTGGRFLAGPGTGVLSGSPMFSRASALRPQGGTWVPSSRRHPLEGPPTPNFLRARSGTPAAAWVGGNATLLRTPGPGPVRSSRDSPLSRLGPEGWPAARTQPRDGARGSDACMVPFGAAVGRAAVPEPGVRVAFGGRPIDRAGCHNAEPTVGEHLRTDLGHTLRAGGLAAPWRARLQ